MMSLKVVIQLRNSSIQISLAKWSQEGKREKINGTDLETTRKATLNYREHYC
jgi:hypothetical protein